jgi:hypothetical protein
MTIALDANDFELANEVTNYCFAERNEGIGWVATHPNALPQDCPPYSEVFRRGCVAAIKHNLLDYP